MTKSTHSDSKEDESTAILPFSSSKKIKSELLQKFPKETRGSIVPTLEMYFSTLELREVWDRIMIPIKNTCWPSFMSVILSVYMFKSGGSIKDFISQSL